MRLAGALLALLAACGGDSFAARERAAPARTGEGEGGAMVLELDLPARVAAGRPVPITLRARNTAPEPVVLGLTGRPVAFDLVVTRPDGREVWRRLHGTAVPMVLGLRRLAPGEALEFTERWPQEDNAGRPVGPGRYLVRGILPLEDGPLATGPRELRIVP